MLFTECVSLPLAAWCWCVPVVCEAAHGTQHMPGVVVIQALV